MPDYRILLNEHNNDPLRRGYRAMTPEQVAADMNTVDRDNWRRLTSAEIFEVIDDAEFQLLSPQLTARVDRVLGLYGEISMAPDAPASQVLLAAFGDGSTTMANLRSLANQKKSRGVEIGWGFVDSKDIVRVRS